MENNANTDAKVSADANAQGADDGISSIPRGYDGAPSLSKASIQTVDVDLDKPDADKGDADDKGGDKANNDGNADDGSQDDGDGGASAKTGDDAPGANTGKKGQDGRYDQNPDWQRMKQERDDALLKVAKMEGRLEALEKGGQATNRSAGDEANDDRIPYDDITQLDDDAIMEKLDGSPRAFLLNFAAQIMSETMRMIDNRTTRQDQTNKALGTFDQYKSEHSDFQALWDSGAITQYMKDHPGHNAISAHMMLTKDQVHQDANSYMQAAIDQAVKETEQRVIKNFQAKKNAQTISGPGNVNRQQPTADDELKDTKSRGGKVSVMAERLQRLRQMATG